jgi:hypothetical protein
MCVAGSDSEGPNNTSNNNNQGDPIKGTEFRNLPDRWLVLSGSISCVRALLGDSDMACFGELESWRGSGKKSTNTN